MSSSSQQEAELRTSVGDDEASIQSPAEGTSDSNFDLVSDTSDEHDSVIAEDDVDLLSESSSNSEQLPKDYVAEAVDSQLWSTNCCTSNLTDRLLTFTANLQVEADEEKWITSLAESEDFPDPPKADTRPSPPALRRMLNTLLPPMSNTDDIFEDIAAKAMENDRSGYGTPLFTFVEQIKHRKLRVATFCSGTESPILALNMIKTALQQLGHESFDFDHIFSCEIEPFKQSYIERNFNPPILFRDATDFSKNTGKATSIYNAEHQIPENVDIVIAGFSCKDFSNLNNKKKTFADLGESGQTYFGIRDYCEKYRPSIVVLENIQNCDWINAKRGFRDIGYFTDHVLVDSKDYYLPQTRNRGYMVAFDAQHPWFSPTTSGEEKSDPDGSDAVVDPMAAADPDEDVTEALKSRDKEKGESLTDHWKEMVENTFVRSASSPYNNFLLQDDDPTLLAVKQRLSHDASLAKGPRMVDWIASRGRHQALRVELQLGFKRPVTLWQNNGSSKVMDHIWSAWAKRQPQRILDNVDISFLRKAETEDMDNNYKARVLELSQNVDREIDRRPAGIVPCVLPSGQPYVTTRGGMITGRESLALQGLPVDRMILTRETNTELQDLAGNAMTSTVVGVATLSALMVGSRLLAAGSGFGKDQDISMRDSSSPADRNECQHFEMIEANLKLRWTTLSNSEIENLGRQGARSIQLCSCEGQNLVKTDRQFFLCRDCGDIRCRACKGNPPHNYVQLPKFTRMQPFAFEEELRAQLPAVIRLSGLSADDLRIGSWFFNGVRPESEKPITPDGPSRSKQAALANIEKEWANLPLEAAYRNYLKVNQEMVLLNIVRSHVWTVTYENTSCRLQLVITPQLPMDHESAFTGLPQTSRFEWLLFIKPHRKEPIGSNIFKILVSPVARLVPSVGLLVGDWQVRVPEEFTINMSIVGSGDLLPSWKARLGLIDDQEVSQELNVRVARDNQRVPDEIRDLEGAYRLHQNCGTAMGSLHKRISTSNDVRSDPSAFLFLDPGLLSDAKDDSFVFADGHHRITYPAQRVVIGRVESGWRPKDASNAAYHKNKYVKLSVAGSWQLKEMKLMAVYVPLRHSLLSEDGASLLDHDSCQRSMPILRFETILRDYQYRNWLPGQQYKIEVLDQPQALAFAAFLKPYLAIHTSSRTSDGWRQLPNLVEGVNQHGLRRCENCAPKKPDVSSQATPGKGKRKMVENSEESAEWERRMKKRPELISATILRGYGATSLVSIDANVTSLVHRAFATLQDMGTPTRDGFKLTEIFWRIAKQQATEEKLDFNKLKIPNLDIDTSQPLCSQPPSFANHQLRNEQLRSLQWMIDQEADDMRPFEHMVIEEACMPTLDARLETKVVAEQYLRGGIVADEVGYGKTATILGLVDSTLNRPCPTARSPQLIPVKATLILMPKIIHGQWVKEVTKFLNWTQPRCLVIRTSKDITVSAVQKADIVLVSHEMLETAAYHQNLRNFAISELKQPVKAGREYEIWLAEQLKNILGLCDSSEMEVSSDESGASPQATQKPSKAPKRAAKKTEPCVPLQCFHFRRIVVDEYTYLDGRSRQMVQTFFADYKWIVSGTPDLANFASVNDMAAFLGARLGPDDDRYGLYKNSGHLNDFAGERTIFEKFDMYQTRHSVAWHEQRHNQAQTFLNHFSRKTKADIDAIPTDEHIVLVSLTAAERLFYSAVHHRLMSREMASMKSKELINDGSLKYWVVNLIQNSDDALEALIRSCSTTVPIAIDTKDMMKSKARELVQTTSRLLDEARKAIFIHLELQRGLSPGETVQDPFINFQHCIDVNAYGDSESMEWLKKLLYFAEQNCMRPTIGKAEEKKKAAAAKKQAKAAKGKGTAMAVNVAPKADVAIGGGKTSGEKSPDQAADQGSDDDGQDARKAAKAHKDWVKATTSDLKLRVDPITELTLDFVEHIRAIRQFAAIAACSDEGGCGMTCSVCHKTTPADRDTYISLSCGHVLCAECWRLSRDGRDCPTGGCDGGMSESSLVAAKQYASASTNLAGGLDAPKSRGSKLDALATMLKQDHRFAADDKVVIFAQYEPIAKDLEACLYDHDIKFVSIGGGETMVELSSDELDRFKDPAQNIQVCILRVESSSAAGLNLQHANHVVFVSSLVKTSVEAYRSTMTQAIGRVRRFLQKKRVHVWHMLAANTMDVNIVQLRHQAVLTQTNGGEVALVGRDGAGLSTGTKVEGHEGEFSGANVGSVALEFGDLGLD